MNWMYIDTAYHYISHFVRSTKLCKLEITEETETPSITDTLGRFFS